MHRGPPSPPPRPIHPIIPPALYDQSILFYTASHETSRPYGSTVRSILLSFSCNAACNALAASPLPHRIPSRNSPGFSSSPPIPLLTSQFPRLSFPRPANRSNVSFRFDRCFLPASSFHPFIPFSSFSPYFSGILIDESPPRKVGKLYCYLSHGIPSFSPLIHPPPHDPTNIFFLLIPLLFLLHRDLDDFLESVHLSREKNCRLYR